METSVNIGCALVSETPLTRLVLLTLLSIPRVNERNSNDLSWNVTKPIHILERKKGRSGDSPSYQIHSARWDIVPTLLWFKGDVWNIGLIKLDYSKASTFTT